jgi:hypothetical protein
MIIRKLSVLLSTISLALLLSGCGSSNKAGDTPGGVAKVSESTCKTCHLTSLDPESKTPIVQEYLASAHNSEAAGCQGCHGGGAGHNGAVPLPFQNPLNSDRCIVCHTKTPDKAVTTNFAGNCAPCHSSTGVSGMHSAQVISAFTIRKSDDCIGCHDIAAPQHGSSLVNDNNGVRAIMPEFTKRSHHITGSTPTNAQCAVCHLEGKVGAAAGAVVVDANFHMKDARIYLRNVDNATGVFAWDGADHAAIDNFCFACHDADGASDLTTLQGLIPAATARNPFADTLTNGYDQVARAGVVDVKTAFTTTNASHHAVSGQRYKYRFSTLANATAWAARTGNPVPASSEIAEGHTVAGVANPFGTGLTYDPAGPEEGGEATLYEGGKFVSTYIPLGASLNVADNSTLHCGDCHTVGQWKIGSSTTADGSTTPVAIGAHGSYNDYLLRNSLGTDVIHNNLTYVCFNCHKADIKVARVAWAEKVAEGLINNSVAPAVLSYNNTDPTTGLTTVVPITSYTARWFPSWKAGWNSLHPNVLAGQFTGYNTAHAVSAMHINCLADSADNIASAGIAGRGVKFNGMSSMRLYGAWQATGVRVYDYIGAPGATATVPTSGGIVSGSNTTNGNITGISCINCHNSGLRNGWGGIHGGDSTYTDGLGRTQKSYRFMPGMGNYRYAPPGGWDGKDTTDPSLMTVNNPLSSTGNGGTGFPGASGKPMGGCYTNSANPATNSNYDADPNPGQNGQAFSTCNHHGTSIAKSQTTINPTGKAANFRTTYGGGTTANPTAFEPTVREATAGGTLVTRPLKY